ncbi:MAG: HAMP domain-containing methyl-accepting chemotaxis protein [Bacillota bacterium]|nr:HAMP domain-containing methyl-accepting chemotaxis protein [Bacillota bacterium]
MIGLKKGINVTLDLLNIKNSIKKKFILVFILIILVMGILSSATYFIISSTADKFNTMIDNTIEGNKLINEARNITTATEANSDNSYLNAYRSSAEINSSSADSLKSKKDLKDSLSRINTTITLLEKDYVKDENVIDALRQARRVYSMIDGDIKSLISVYEKKDIAQAATLINKITQNCDILINSAQDIIAAELTVDQQQKNSLNKESARTGMIIIILIVAIGACSIIIAYIITKRIAGTISKLANISQNIASGNLQTKSLEVKSKDEISVLARAFNSMTENLRSLIRKIADSSFSIAHSSDLLKAGAQQNTRAIEQIAATIQQVSYGAAEQSQKSQESVEVIKNILTGNQKVYDNAQVVLSTSDKATKAAEVGNERMENLLGQISTIENKIIETRDVTDTLKKQMGEIKKILDVINQIASQTNLLSLNAAIEAARAGEHGKGFAVVADSIRKLAAASSGATKEITDILTHIARQSERVAESMESGVSVVREGTQMAYEARESFTNIVGTSKEVNNQIEQINSEIEKMIAEIGSVEEMSKNIAEIAKQSSAGSQEVAAAIEEQTASLQEILSSASDLSEMAVGLETTIKSFKL